MHFYFYCTYMHMCKYVWASQVALVGKNPPADAWVVRLRFSHWVWNITCRMAWQLIPVFLPGESHGQRSHLGYSPLATHRVRHNWSDLAYTHVCRYECYIYIYIYMYVCVCMCIYICMCMYICMCTHTHTHTHTYANIHLFRPQLHETRNQLQEK